MKAITLISTVAFLASANLSVAAEEIVGIVESVNTSNGTLSLQSGHSFTFDNATVLYGILPGQRIGVTYEGPKGIGAYNPHPARRRDIDID